VVGSWKGREKKKREKKEKGKKGPSVGVTCVGENKWGSIRNAFTRRRAATVARPAEKKRENQGGECTDSQSGRWTQSSWFGAAGWWNLRMRERGGGMVEMKNNEGAAKVGGCWW
jgi:hypothetical protein